MMKRILVSAGVAVGAVFLAVFWWKISLSPVDGRNSAKKAFVIAKGDGVREIARKLHDQKLIRDQIAFFVLIKTLGIEKNIQAGSFKLSPNEGAREIALQLTRGTEDKWITIIEGLRSEEILEQTQKEDIDAGKWSVASELVKWKADEGKIFPDTYLIPKQITIDGLHQLLVSSFNQKLTAKMKEDIAAAGRTLDQTVILASLLEREGRSDKERAQIADVLLKRLKRDMALDVDATVQYALGEQTDGSWWKKELTLEDIKVKSPFNTYVNPGLPPAPICNPGLGSTMAAIYPEANPYYFYLHDKNGQIHFAVTLDEHNQNVAKYL